VNTKNWQLAPEANFKRELQRLGLVSGSTEHVAMTESPEEQTEIAEIRDLTEALATAAPLKSESESTNSTASSVTAQYKAIRQKLGALKQMVSEPPGLPDPIEGSAREQAMKLSKRISEEVDQIKRLPEEFALYIKGSANWHTGDITEARKYWKQLLELPAPQRRYRSTWAAFRLGKSYLGSDSTLAKENFDLLRRQVELGFKDSLDLAQSSYGWEAQMAYEANAFGDAIRLYLKQGNEQSAIQSLRLTASKALEGASPAELQELAANVISRNVITAYLISEPRGYDAHPDTIRAERVSRWLEAVEAASATDDSTAECLVLAAYQADLIEECSRWIERAPASITARWLRAKLLLKEHKIDAACGILKKLVTRLPILDKASSTPRTLEENLVVYHYDYRESSAGKLILADLGVVQLARNQFVESLDAFMKAGFWSDVAYVAERIVTLDELQRYVDEKYSASKADDSAASDSDSAIRPSVLRNLLARRLMRANRLDDARPYFDPECLSLYEEFIKDMRIGFGSEESPDVRAIARLHAAKTMYSEGGKLLATEGEPDWHMHPSAEYGLTEEDRSKAEEDQLPPTEEELKRLHASALKHSFRYHYRYVAAELAWHAALLMPNNADETAIALCQAGSWIKYLDPKRADRFYKALVRRCRQTEMGQAADKKRWFPALKDDADSKTETE